MKTTKTISLILTLLFSVATLAFGQTYAQPGEVRIERLVRQAFPQYYGRGNRYPALIPETFFPIGWSKDGKFAYYTEPVDEACGCYYANLVIQDLRTDKVLWEFRYSQDDTYEGDKMTGPGDIRKLWAKNRKLFSEKLAENGIIAGRSTMLGKTFSAARSRFTAKATIKMGKNPDEDYRRITIFNIALSSPKLGSKSVYDADYTKEEYGFMLGAGLIGVIKSPFENRVAIVGFEVTRGYEGPPHTGGVRIVGADLASGFKK